MLGSPQEAHALLHTLPHSGTQIKVLLRRSLEFLPMQWYNRGDKKEVTSMLVSTRGRYALRVMLAGRAVLYARSELMLEDRP